VAATAPVAVACHQVRPGDRAGVSRAGVVVVGVEVVMTESSYLNRG
jgi:hypothetical protein